MIFTAIITVCLMPMIEGPPTCDLSVQPMPIELSMVDCIKVVERSAELELLEALRKDSLNAPLVAKGVCIIPSDVPALLNQMADYSKANGISHNVRFYP